MRLMTAVATAAVIFAGATAQAGPISTNVSRDVPGNSLDNALPNPGQMGLQVGMGVICNTTGQAERYVRLRARGEEIAPAMTQVNQEAKDPKACGVAAIAFKRGKIMDTKSMNGSVVDIVQVNVLAGYDGSGWARVPETTQYAVIESEGIEI